MILIILLTYPKRENSFLANRIVIIISYNGYKDVSLSIHRIYIKIEIDLIKEKVYKETKETIWYTGVIKPNLTDMHVDENKTVLGYLLIGTV